MVVVEGIIRQRPQEPFFLSFLPRLFACRYISGVHDMTESVAGGFKWTAGSMPK